MFSGDIWERERKRIQEMLELEKRIEHKARRERIAIAMAQGLLTSETADDCYEPGELVKRAVSLADAMITVLDAEQKE